MFKKSLECDPNQPNHIQNYGIFLGKIKKNSVEAEKLFKQGIDLEKKLLSRSSSGEFPEDEQMDKNSQLTKAQKRNLRRKKAREKFKKPSDTDDDIFDDTVSSDFSED